MEKEFEKLVQLQTYYNELALHSKDQKDRGKYNGLAQEVMKKKQKLREQIFLSQYNRK